MRVLVAAEGPVDEVVLGMLRQRVGAEVTYKTFQSRGIDQVLRLATDVVRAAHFGGFDLLVIHADADDSPPHQPAHVEARCRVCRLEACVATAMPTLRDIGRASPLRTVVAVPCQSTDAWLLWGRDDGAPTAVEQRHRHDVKRALFGERKSGHEAAALGWVGQLRDRLDRGEMPPEALQRVVLAVRR
ncbi:MAG: hypothetical protein HY904_16720 [Deltaproteobacteria bacterium]|nr:hypothetical protein [Deltaproteobacteria bacterium]